VSETDSHRYGQTKVTTIYAEFQECATAVRKGDFDQAEKALDRFLPWADFLFSDPLAHVEALAERWKGNVGTDNCGHELAQLCEELRGGGE
jgi:dihydrodipicolinate synthase/N-acetylneuraminate lyase